MQAATDRQDARGDDRPMQESSAPSSDDAAALAVADLQIERMRHALAAGDYAAASAAARDGWYEILTLRGSAARELLEAASPSKLKDEPLLLMLLGVVYNANLFQRARALRYFAAASMAARREGDKQLAPLDRALIRTGQSAASRLLGRPGMGVEPARKAVQALDELTTAQRAQARNISRLYAQSGMTLYYGGHAAEAIDAFTKGLAEAPASAPREGFGSLAMLAGIHARDGHLAEARMLVEKVRDVPALTAEMNGYTGTFYRIAEAMLSLESFDAASAKRHIGAAAPNRRVVEHWLAVAETEALTSLVAGAAADGLAQLEETVGVRGAEARSTHARQQLAKIRGLLQLALGDLDAAAAIAQRDPRAGAGAHIERARVALAMGQPGTALKELKVIAGSPLSPRSAAEAAAIEIAVLTRYPPRPRLNALTMRLAAVLLRSGLRLPLALLPTDDLHRVLTELSRVGAGELAQLVPGSLLLDALPEVSLTKRELAVLAELAERSSVGELARALGVSPNTVKTQLRSLYRKLGAAGREDAIAIALDRHLLAPPSLRR